MKKEQVFLAIVVAAGLAVTAYAQQQVTHHTLTRYYKNGFVVGERQVTCTGHVSMVGTQTQFAQIVYAKPCKAPSTPNGPTEDVGPG